MSTPDRLESPAEPSLPDVRRLVAAANAARGPTDAARQLDVLFRTSHRLAVYGSLAPGQPNHHVVAPLGGEWTDGLVAGELVPAGWGAALGYPAFRPGGEDATIAVQVLAAPALAAAWPTLDRFEGPEYRRILVPVFFAGAGNERRFATVANIYAATESITTRPPAG